MRRRDRKEYIRMVVEIQGKRREEAEEKMDAVKNDMLRYDLSDEDVVDRIR